GGTTEGLLAMTERQVQLLARLVDDLLDVSRITRGKIELRKQIVNLATVVNRAVEAARPWVEERRHTLTISLPSRPILLEADTTRLEQILANLLNNACKYTESTGRISLMADRDGDQAVIRVRDTGIGLEPDMISRIFDLFWQGQQ